ncbi:MAG: HAD-IIA family hydrolase [Clostridia bacterium]
MEKTMGTTMDKTTVEKLNKIKLFLFDMDGTVYLGDKEIFGSFKAIKMLKSQGKQICFLTNNSSKTREMYVQKLQSLGFVATLDEIYTSSEATCEFLNKNYFNKKVYIVATPQVTDFFASKNINIVTDNPDICVLTFDTTLTYEKLNTLCRFIQNGVPFVATHPDNFCPSNLGNMPDIGGFLRLIDATTNAKPIAICGKPNKTMGEAIIGKFNLRAEEIAMVGDRLYTDIQFAINNNFLSVLVLSGETTMQEYENWGKCADVVLNSLNDLN